jgi:excinuclease ABC subunit C
MLPELVLEKLKSLPVQPGVYLFKDAKGVIVYVGKAKSLRSRVRSYFQAGGSDERFFIPILQRTLGDLETIITNSELEATILENTLIKEHHPRYNVKLRDDKEYLSLRLSVKDQWPRLYVVRTPSQDGARYFGPYGSATAGRRTLHLVNKHFQLRTCGDTEFAMRKRPCLQHQIKRCPAPCVLEVDQAFYDEQVHNVALFLDGRHDELSREVLEKMHAAARAMRFELAAIYRDQLRAIEKVREGQRVVSTDESDRDVVGFYREGELVEIAALRVRGGKLFDVATTSIKQAEIPDEEIVAAFVAQRYGRSEDADVEAVRLQQIPDEIVVPFELEGRTGISEWLGERAGHKVAVAMPKRGARVGLLALANENAKHSFAEKRRRSDDVESRLKDLQERLRLKSIPRRIECCDISHLGGGDTVGAVVAMLDGDLDKKRYRTFHVRGTGAQGADVNDDYASMYEVLARRFRRARIAESAEEKDENVKDEQSWDAPDLFVVDGGRGQLGVALTAARDLGLHELAIVGLAKERENIQGEALVDRVYLPGQKNPIPLKSSTTSLYLLARLRDEAHRFSNKAREKLGKKKRFHSVLDDVKGLGPAAKKALLMRYGAVPAILAAPDDELLGTPGVATRHVKALRAVFPVSAPARDEGKPTSIGGEELAAPALSAPSLLRLGLIEEANVRPPSPALPPRSGRGESDG